MSRRAPQGVAKPLSNPEEVPWTMSVPEAGKIYFGLSRNGSYEAAKRGDIPTLWVGGKLRALPRKIERQLSGDAA